MLDLRRFDPLTALDRLSTLLYRSFDYEAGVTGADSPLDDALVAGKGVCQDFAHIMIAICRAWGVPARYVSGYLSTDRDHGERSDPQATHAWVEAFLPSLRWIGFDPTNDVLACERHIAVAIGRDYSDVPPSRGVFKGDAESQLSVGVSVRQAFADLAETGIPAAGRARPGRRPPACEQRGEARPASSGTAAAAVGSAFFDAACRVMGRRRCAAALRI